MTSAPQTYNPQTKLWNGSVGHAWVDAQEVLDGMFKPLEDLLVEAALAAPGDRVLDVGCGTGGAALTIARRIGAAGRCVGVDISEPMIAAAQAHAEKARAEHDDAPASFIRADAQSYAFEPASFDVIISRFGVMFFDDSVVAFTNLRRAARKNAALRFITWRGAEENLFMTTAERAAAPLLPNLPPRAPNAPGQFAFADPSRVHAILDDSGWVGVDIQPVDVTCILPESALVPFFTRLGPLGVVLHEADDETRAHVIETVRAAFEPYVHGTEVRFTAACWMVSAQAPS